MTRISDELRSAARSRNAAEKERIAIQRKHSKTGRAAARKIASELESALRAEGLEIRVFQLRKMVDFSVNAGDDDFYWERMGMNADRFGDKTHCRPVCHGGGEFKSAPDGAIEVAAYLSLHNGSVYNVVAHSIILAWGGPQDPIHGCDIESIVDDFRSSMKAQRYTFSSIPGSSTTFTLWEAVVVLVVICIMVGLCSGRC
jgi:hypothetical protein